MVCAYLYYPRARITVHHDPACAHVQSQQKAAQRVVRISVDTLSAELQRFHAQEHTFAPNSAQNDMWVFLDLGDGAFEEAVVAHIQYVLGRRYSPFARTDITTCC